MKKAIFSIVLVLLSVTFAFSQQHIVNVNKYQRQSNNSILIYGHVDLIKASVDNPFVLPLMYNGYKIYIASNKELTSVQNFYWTMEEVDKKYPNEPFWPTDKITKAVLIMQTDSGYEMTTVKEVIIVYYARTGNIHIRIDG